MNRFELALGEGEIDLRRCLASGQVFRFREEEAGVWRGADGPYSHCFSVRGRGELVVETDASAEEVGRFLNLDRPLSGVRGELLRRGPEMEPILAAVPGLRLLRPSSFREVVFCFLCTANNHLSRIGQMIRHLEDVSFRPDEQTESHWRERGFGYRGAWIPKVARELAERGENWPQEIRQLPRRELQRELMTLTGVGPKLADCIALYGLHRDDVTPIDTHLWQALTRLYFPEWHGASLTSARYELANEFLVDRFGDLAAYAHLYLYHENQLFARTRTERTKKTREK